MNEGEGFYHTGSPILKMTCASTGSRWLTPSVRWLPSTVKCICTDLRASYALNTHNTCAGLLAPDPAPAPAGAGLQGVVQGVGEDGRMVWISRTFFKQELQPSNQ